MSVIAGATPEDFRLDTSQTKSVPFARLVKVELRKLYDTRSGFWLLIAIGIITVLAVGLFAFFSDRENLTFAALMAVTATPQGMLLPVLGILLVTSEFSQRSTLTTFTLEPHRWRVIVAKIVAALIAGLLFLVLAMAVAALVAVLFGAERPFEGFSASLFGHYILMQELGIMQGLAFGLLLLNSPAAIVLFFVIPMAFNIIVNIVGVKSTAIHDLAPWIDLGTAQRPLIAADSMTGEQWAHLGVAAAIWVFLPLLLGFIRVLRAEVK